jgi:ketosteroid isomerase-like protein
MDTSLMLAGVALLGGVMAKAADPEASSEDSNELEALNREYVRSAVGSDVGWFERNLAADFVCSNPDGSLVERAGFLKQTAAPRGISNVELHDVLIRVMGDFALIHARTTFTAKDGQPGSIRYTDAWARQHGRWVAVSAQLTPVR